MKKNKVVIIGAGMVGMSYAYSMVNQGTCEELVLIDIDKKRTVGEALDLNHGLSYAPRKMKIYSGDYSDCNDANIICITAGAIQVPGETRLDLLHKNTKIMKSIVGEIKKTNFNGIIIVASNPVDIMTYVVWKASGYDRNKIMGSGTTLDTARLRFGLGERLGVTPKSIHAYVMGEHGDSQFVAWSYALMGVQPIYQVASKKDAKIKFEDLEFIEDEVRNIAYKIIDCKKSTYYGIGMALTRITKAILDNENSILTVSSYLDNKYGHDDVFIAVPSIVNEEGVSEVIELPLDKGEKEKFDNSIKIMKENISKLDI